MTTAIIIDDEPRSVATLKNLIRDYCPDLQVINTAQSVEEGIKVLQSNQPNLLFLDIAMPDGSGFDLLEGVEHKEFEVIFTTAFDQYAIKAFDFSAMNYLLKPINPEELQKVVEQYKSISSKKDNPTRFKILENSLQDNFNRIALPCLDGIEFVELNDIVYCEADSNYCTFFLNKGSKTVVSRPLNTYEKLLSDSFFYRIHHKYLVNLKQVNKYIKGSGGQIILKNGTVLDVSVRKKEGFLKKMAMLTGL